MPRIVLPINDEMADIAADWPAKLGNKAQTQSIAKTTRPRLLTLSHILDEIFGILTLTGLLPEPRNFTLNAWNPNIYSTYTVSSDVQQPGKHCIRGSLRW